MSTHFHANTRLCMGNPTILRGSASIATAELEVASDALSRAAANAGPFEANPQWALPSAVAAALETHCQGKQPLCAWCQQALLVSWSMRQLQALAGTLLLDLPGAR